MRVKKCASEFFFISVKQQEKIKILNQLHCVTVDSANINII